LLYCHSPELLLLGNATRSNSIIIHRRAGTHFPLQSRWQVAGAIVQGGISLVGIDEEINILRSAKCLQAIEFDGPRAFVRFAGENSELEKPARLLFQMLKHRVGSRETHSVAFPMPFGTPINDRGV